MKKQMVAMTVMVILVITFLRIDMVSGFSIPVHRDMTMAQLSMITAQIAGQPKHFSQRALEQIMKANAETDHGFSAALFHSDRHFTNEEFVASSQRLIDLKNEIIMSLTANPPDGNTARNRLGGALHTIQDFYSHSNWVERQNAVPRSGFGAQVMPNPSPMLHTCPTDPDTIGPDGGGGLTSAYFKDPSGCNLFVPTGKCNHGNYTSFCPGINKDNDVTVNGIPPSSFHPEARRLAELSTKDYVELILSEIAGNDKAVSALLDVKGTVGFVIDDTGSMGEEITGVKNIVTLIVNFLKIIPFAKPENFLLERFGDPDVGPAFVTDDASALLSAVNALTASGGGDCPELSQTGLLEALDRAFPNSRLFVFTDASAKDASLANAVISKAQQRSISINYLLTGSCSPIDPVYIRGAEETGGQLFMVNQFEIDKLFNLIKPQLSGDLQTILSAKGLLANNSRSFDIPVDSTIQSLVASVSTSTGNSIALRRPSGVLVNPSDPDAQITDLSSGRIFTMNGPTAGLWKVEISGNGEFAVQASGNSPIDFNRFDFVEPNADIHGGFFPIEGQPLAGSPSIGEATLLGPSAAATFKLVDEGGSIIQPINLVQNFPNAARDHFLGQISLPAMPFKVVATGTDLSGFPFQRQFPAVYRAQSVGVKVEGLTTDSVRPGTTNTIRFVVTNLGSVGTFSINVVDNRGFITVVNPTLLNIGMGQSATILVTVTIPASTPPNTELTITATATRTDNLSVFNSAIVNLIVEGSVFNVCLQDDSNGNIFQLNSTTGEYQLLACRKGFRLTGSGKVTSDFCKIGLSDSGPDPKRPDRNVSVQVNSCTRVASASIRIPSTGVTYTIADRDIANNTCSCSASR